MSNVAEAWRAVPGYEGKYEVSNLGRVRSMDRIRTQVGRWGGEIQRRLTGKVLSPGRDKDGYCQVQLGEGNIKKVHHLVAAAWIGPRPDGSEVNHKNGRVADNDYGNLEYATPKQNIAHAYGTGLHRGLGETHYAATLTEETVREIRSASSDVTTAELARRLGIKYANVWQIRKGLRWRHLDKST